MLSSPSTRTPTTQRWADTFTIDPRSSSTRLPFHSTVDFLTGLPGLAEPATAPGILARHSESIPVLMDALSNAPSVPGAPRVDQAGEIKHWSLDNLISGRPLRVGVAFREASPALHAALARVSEALGKQPNIEVVPFQIPEKMWKEIAPLWGDLASVAGFKDGLEMVGDDPLVRALPVQVYFRRQPES